MEQNGLEPEVGGYEVTIGLIDLDELLEGSELPDAATMDEYTASKVMRSVRYHQNEAERLKAYKKALLAEVAAKLDARIQEMESKAEARKELIQNYLKTTKSTKISFPDIGTFYFSSSEKAEYDEAAIKGWLDGDGAKFAEKVTKTEVKLDKTALKNLFKNDQVVVPGLKLWKEETLAFKAVK